MALIEGPHIPTPMQSGDRVVCRACGRPVTRRFTDRSWHFVHSAGPRTTPDMHDRLVESMDRDPEGIEVRVTGVLIVTEDIAREVAPLLARTLYPDRTFGGVLTMARDPGDGSWYVVVEDRGPRRFANRTGIEAPR